MVLTLVRMISRYQKLGSLNRNGLAGSSGLGGQAGTLWAVLQETWVEGISTKDGNQPVLNECHWVFALSSLQDSNHPNIIAPQPVL